MKNDPDRLDPLTEDFVAGLEAEQEAAATRRGRWYPARRRPKKVDSYVWCDAHGTIHEAQADPYEEGMEECLRANWRSVYVLADPGESFD